MSSAGQSDTYTAYLPGLDDVQSIVQLGYEWLEILEPIAGGSDNQNACGQALEILLELDASVHRKEHLKFRRCQPEQRRVLDAAPASFLNG
jgi:hypothetical protein